MTALSILPAPELTEDQLLARKQVLYALRNTPEAENRAQAMVVSADGRRVCAIGLAARTLGLLVPISGYGHYSTRYHVERIAVATGWDARDLTYAAKLNDQACPWERIADYLENPKDAG